MIINNRIQLSAEREIQNNAGRESCQKRELKTEPFKGAIKFAFDGMVF
jgi:hypothetical protein